MGLNISKGNMYPFVTHTWNTVKGRCPHGCSYCYMKKWGEQPPVRFDEKELRTDLEEKNFIFVGSSCDMWARDIPDKWIYRTLTHCQASKNRFLFQSKNPERFFNTVGKTTALWLKENAVFGTTIETNRTYPQMGQTPKPWNRATALHDISFDHGFQVMVTVEPIMNFDLDDLVRMIVLCNPSWVNIGADSQGHSLPEPSRKKIKFLIVELEKFTNVVVKKNLSRLMK